MRLVLVDASVAMLIAGAAAAQVPGRSPWQLTEAQGQAALAVPAYAELLRGFDTSKPESIVRARDEAIAKYAAADGQSADAVFRQLWSFCNRTVWNVQRAFYEQLNWGSSAGTLLSLACKDHVLRCSGRDVDEFLASTEPDAVQRRAERKDGVALLTRCRKAGIAFYYGEGDWYSDLDPEFVVTAAAKLPLAELREWVRFWAVESLQRLGEDAGLVVTWDAVRERIARWEAFARAHPSLPETADEVAPHVKSLVGLYVFGIDNSPAYDERFGGAPGRRRIDPKLLESYRRFVVLNQGSEYTHLIRGIIDSVDRHEGAPSEELKVFVADQLRDPTFKDRLRGMSLWK